VVIVDESITFGSEKILLILGVKEVRARQVGALRHDEVEVLFWVRPRNGSPDKLWRNCKKLRRANASSEMHMSTRSAMIGFIFTLATFGKPFSMQVTKEA